MNSALERPKYRLGELSQGSSKPVIVGGVRTPFVKSFTLFKDMDSLDLSAAVVNGLIHNLGVEPELIDEIIMGAVIPQIKNPNVARDTILQLGLPSHIHGFTLSQACASSLQSVTLAAKTIAYGHPHLIVAGGVECLSQVPITYSEGARKTLIALSRAKNLALKWKALKKFQLSHWIPSPPPLAEPLTGLTMGQHGEIMAEKNEISRKDQDLFALASHQKASQAQKKGILAEEILPLWPAPHYKDVIDHDTIIRSEGTLESLSKLKPVFSKPYGTLTAGNSSPLTDGAAATLVCDEKRAKALGFEPLVEVVDVEFVGCDPYDQLLVGPALAIPRILKKHRLKISDIDRFEIHEAFAAQTLSCLELMDRKKFFEDNFGTSRVLGRIPDEKINVNGGAIAIGHPFAASGSRLVNSLALELKRHNLEYGLIAMCSAGGMAGCMLLKNCG